MIMTKKQNNRFFLFNLIMVLFVVIGLVKTIYSQAPVNDFSFHPYRINYWVTGTILGVGATTNYLGIGAVLNKEEVTPLEIQTLNKGIISGFDFWALKQDPSNMDAFENYSDYTVTVSVLLPVLLLFDKQIKQD